MNQNDGTADAAIDEAVAHCRAGVRHIKGTELDELADHVASSARTLPGGALSPDEAVCIAARRLGAERELVREFERGDGRTRNFDPLALLLLGAAGALVLVPLTKVHMTLMALFTGYMGIGDQPWAAELLGLLFLAPFALLIPLMRWRGAAATLTRVARRPWIFLAIAFVLLCLPHLVLIDLRARVSLHEFVSVFSHHWTVIVYYFAPSLLVPLLLLGLAVRRTRAVAAAEAQNA